MTRRAVPEWVGATPDSAIPPRVKLRIWERAGGICGLTGRKIMPGDAYDFDHIVALANGGEHREANLRPVLRDAHRAKTAEDVAEKARVDRKRKKHLGMREPRAILPGSRRSGWKRKIDGTWERRE